MRAKGEGNVQRRKADGSIYWEARVAINGRRVSFHDVSRTVVLAKARQARVDARRGVAATGSNMTTEAYLRRWLEHVQPALRARTFSSYSAHCRLYIIPAVGRVRLAQLTPGHVERMLAKLLRSGLSATTVAHVRGTLCLMGHSMLSATESYAHTIPASLDRDMASVDQAL